VIAFAAGITALVLMLAETWLSRSNERRLRARGAVEPSGDVYALMAVAYPASFVAMVVEGVLGGPPGPTVVWTGIATFVAAKVIKYWAIGSLGPMWTFRVLVLTGAPLVTTGPYAWVRHPNYVGVVGELLGIALITGAWVTGPLAIAGFGYLLYRRIEVEDRALGRDQPARRGV
jgi:methyltransferase